MMKEGPASKIEYIAVDRVPRTAYLTEVKLDKGGTGATNPVWHIQHRDDPNADAEFEWIDYVTQDLKTKEMSMYQAKPFSNLVIEGISKTTAEIRLEHRQLPSGQSLDSDGIVFLDWDGQPWIATLPNIEIPGTPQFILRSLK